MPHVFVGLGSNIDPINNIKAGVTMLRMHWPEIRFASVYETAPMGFTDQGTFLNSAALLTTDQSPEEVFGLLRLIESKRGKSTPFPNGPRTIDLDLLLYGSHVLPSATEWEQLLARTDMARPLVIPHLRMHERRFVLEPLLELLDPADSHPVLRRSWHELWKDTEHQHVRKTSMRL